MKIVSGLFDNMVLQRDSSNRSRAAFRGECAHDGLLMARVLSGRRPVRGFNRFKVGKCSGEKFSGLLAGLPAGGPYDIELALKDKSGPCRDVLRIKNVLVGDVWILGGQSNMQGCGYRKYALRPQKMVRAFYMNDRWDNARDPIHNLDQAVDQAHADLCGGHLPAKDQWRGVGPGVAFGQDMYARTGVPQGLIACAHGGTSMSQWDPALKTAGSRSLYGAMLRRFRKNGSRIAGMVWYQGCSDASGDDVPRYTGRMVNFVRSARRDLGDTQFPFVMVQIAGFCSNSDPTGWNRIQEQQRRLPEKIKRLAVVPAIDLSLDDGIHISGFDQNRLGRRLAQAMSVLLGKAGAGLPPIALHSIRTNIEKRTGVNNVMVRFKNVTGHLQAVGKPAGFTILNGSEINPALFRIDLERDTAVLKLSCPVSDPMTLSVHYGYGMAPYCNITDSADRSLPVFGPIGNGNPKAMTRFMQTWLVSRAMPSAGKLETLVYPGDKNPLELKARSFGDIFCDLHLDLFAARKDVLVYFASTVSCIVRMNLDLLLGYDGPVKVWIDGREVFHDPRGTNPARADMIKIPWKASKGKHEIMIALGSNNGRAWGIFVRMHRKDVPPRLLKSGLYHLPVIT